MTAPGLTKCVTCDAEVDASARFCPSCGRGLYEDCPSCGAEARIGARFCASCGARLDAPTAKDEERKLVTVLFADLTGSTALGERLDPERLRALLGEYFAAMASVIESWGGVVEKYIGDAVMAVFGVPLAREDDAERALRAALAMQARLDALNYEIAERHRVALAVRIGVNSGEVIAGIGAGDQLIVTGDAVNVAARLQQTAEPGDVVAGERTYLATRGVFRAEPIEDRLLKGKSLPVRAWRVAGTAEPSAGSELAPARSGLVGRARELALLETLYRGSVEEARPQLVTILGHAGIGKSRLSEEFVAAARARTDGADVYRGRCLPYGTGITYWALREILWEAAGILFDDPAEVAAEKLRQLVDLLFEDDGDESGEADSVRFALATTAGIALPDNPLDDSSPESIGEELGLAWPAFLTALARRAPTVIVIDDLHRAETPLLDMIEHLLARSAGPLFLVTTGRPELAQLRPGWSAKAGMTQISLEPLADAHAEQLVDEVAPTVGAALRTQILAAAEGNPLFVEEIVEHLVDQGVLARRPGAIVEVAADARVTIPDTIRAVLAARVDALPVEEKRILQDAAVVGRVFWATTLESMGDQPVRPALRALESKGLLLTRPASSLPGQTELTFRHGLIREVAYDSIPKARRAAAHAGVAAWIEEVAGDRRDEFVELVAYHYEAAARPEDAELAWPDDPAHRDEIRATAVAALIDAGRAEAATFAVDQALGFGDRALALARTDRERMAAHELKARAAHASVRADDAWGYYLEALAAAERLGDRGDIQRLRALTTLLWARWRGAMTIAGWRPKAIEIMERGLEEAGDGPASFELGAFLTGRSARSFWNLAPDSSGEARRDAERAAAIAQEIGSETLLSYALDMLYYELTRGGFCESADFARRAVAVGRDMEDRAEAHELLVTAALAFAHVGRFDEAAAVGAETEALASRLGPHRTLHTGSAMTAALLPPGRLGELAEATSAAPTIVAQEGMHTCLHGLAALAGLTLCAFESGDRAGAQRALDVFDSAATAGAANYRDERKLEILRPLIGVAEARRRLAELEPAESAAPGVLREVNRLRLELQLGALERNWDLVDGLARRAPSLARRACAPYLEWIADWSLAVGLACRGGSDEASARATAAAAALDAYGERYLAARLLVDLLPALEPQEARAVANDVIPRLEAMAAGATAAEARQYA